MRGGGTIARQRERHRPVPAQHAALLRGVLEFLEVLVVADGRRHQGLLRQPTGRSEPLTPLAVIGTITSTDQIASEQAHARLGCSLLRGTHHPADVADVLVLGITEVQQGQRLVGGGQRTQLVPCAPAAIALHAVDVQGIRLQAIDICSMVV